MLIASILLFHVKPSTRLASPHRFGAADDAYAPGNSRHDVRGRCQRPRGRHASLSTAPGRLFHVKHGVVGTSLTAQDYAGGTQAAGTVRERFCTSETRAIFRSRCARCRLLHPQHGLGPADPKSRGGDVETRARGGRGRGRRSCDSAQRAESRRRSESRRCTHALRPGLSRRGRRVCVDRARTVIRPSRSLRLNDRRGLRWLGPQPKVARSPARAGGTTESETRTSDTNRRD